MILPQAISWSLVFVLPIAAVAPPAPPDTIAFKLTFDPARQTTAYTGRVYVIISKNLERPPIGAIREWFNPPRIIAKDVRQAAHDAPLFLGTDDLGHPGPLSELPAGTYHIQAVARRNLDNPVPGYGAGDLFSQPQVVELDPARPQTFSLNLDQVAEARPFKETDRIKLVEMVSPSLSRFHEREVRIRASVLLPREWEDRPDARYPALYLIPGFGGDHRMVRFIERIERSDRPAGHHLTVVPDPACFRGHSVFADSANNGPWGHALIEELVPEIERRFHGPQSGSQRYVTGVSSGGWSSLWLQITYPDSFNGCWSHVPDPVDFRDFQRINLYESPANMFTDREGQRRPLARDGETVLLWYDDFVHREDVLGPGGQIHSFEAVFSRRRADGTPAPLFDRETGAVDPAVARSWEAFDIRLVLERNWKKLEPKLAGKLHIFAGGKDTFYLEGAVKLLAASLTNLGSDAEVKVIPEMAHGLYNEALEPMYETIRANFERAFPQPAAPSTDGGP